MSEEQQKFETAGNYRLFHGSMNHFDEFNLEHEGSNGTAQGFGIYLTPNKEMATMYSSRNNEKGYLYKVNVDLERPLSLDDRTVSSEELSKIIDRLQKSNDILNDFNDVDYYGEKMVKREALAVLNENENDVDLMNELANTIGDNEETAKAFYEVGHYTHAVAEEQLRQRDSVVIVFQPERVTIEEVQDLNREMDVPAVTANPFADDSTKFASQYQQVQDFWMETIRQEKSFEVIGHNLLDGSERTSRLFTPSTQAGYEFQLTYLNEDGEPISHYELSRKDIEDTLNGTTRELIDRLPYSTENSEYTVKFVENNQEIERVQNMAKGFNGKNVSEIPIKELVIKDFEQELETTKYYDKQAWQERIEYLQGTGEGTLSRLSLDEDVEVFYESHKEEIEQKIDFMAETLSADRLSILGLKESSSDMDYKRVSSNLAYNLAMSEIYSDLDKGSFEIPPMSKEAENRVLKVKNTENTRSFEME